MSGPSEPAIGSIAGFKPSSDAGVKGHLVVNNLGKSRVITPSRWESEKSAKGNLFTAPVGYAVYRRINTFQDLIMKRGVPLSIGEAMDSLLEKTIWNPLTTSTYSGGTIPSSTLIAQHDAQYPGCGCFVGRFF